MRRSEQARAVSVGLGGGAEKLKRGDEHAEFVRKEKEKLKTAAASQMSHSRKEGQK